MHGKPETRGLESADVAEVLALAQKLQAKAAGLQSEEQVIELGRELGLEPQHVREAIRLRQRAAPDAVPRTTPAAEPADDRPLGLIGRALLILLGIGMLPPLLQWMAMTGGGIVALLAFPSALVMGWLARYPRLAALGGAATVPIALLLYFFYAASGWASPNRLDETVIASLVMLGPYCAAAGIGAAKFRRSLEEPAPRAGWAAPRH